jgi:HipA-like protein
MTGHLAVWWDGRVAGSLHRDQHGDMGFIYAPEWLEDGKAPALSFSLPKRAEAYGRRECQAFFGSILPEEGQRHAIASALSVSAENEFRLLEHLGGEVAGALIHRRVKQLCDATLNQIDAPDGELHNRLPDDANFAPFADLIHERALKLWAKE